jgi:hypothetical protein
MNDENQLDDLRLFRGPGLVEVYVPPKPPPKPEDIYLDFPPGEPPAVRYFGVSANYWVVLREGRMLYRGMTKVFDDEVMQWLREIEPEVERLLQSDR